MAQRANDRIWLVTAQESCQSGQLVSLRFKARLTAGNAGAPGPQSQAHAQCGRGQRFPSIESPRHPKL